MFVNIILSPPLSSPPNLISAIIILSPPPPAKEAVAFYERVFEAQIIHYSSCLVAVEGTRNLTWSCNFCNLVPSTHIIVSDDGDHR
ncbi:hypothetical protein Pyn_27858 [Prunus yedoensis var. nudiflora]|uniref:Uncharacterized protein n=1 Tax=Prunus yedoensis var. nudiflora TaxID=2094558 RepID=A0A314ZG72_PRUYE|nr:hypothetical protein Pyn_27858 [Prunus yedoensis var. nudiflora]